MDFPKNDGGIWLSAALEHVRDGVMGVDTAGGVVWMNPVAQRLIGRQGMDAAGSPAGDLFASLKTVLNNGTLVHLSRHKLICAGRPSVCVDCTIAPVLMGGKCRGAVIVFSLNTPEDTPDAPSKMIQEEKPPVHGRGDAGRILVMDDDDMVRNLTVQKLIRYGYESVGVSSGEEALSRFQAAIDSGKPFDVVILDLIVRGGMGGREAIEALRDIDPDVKAILTSGHAADPVLTNFWEYGFSGVVRKPFVIKELDITIRQVLEEE